MKSDTNTPIDGTNPTDNTTIEKTNTIPIDIIIQLYNAGLRKLVPLLHDSKRANVYDHLITDEEIKAFPSAEGKPVCIIFTILYLPKSKLLDRKTLAGQGLSFPQYCYNIWSYRLKGLQRQVPIFVRGRCGHEGSL